MADRLHGRILICGLEKCHAVVYQLDVTTREPTIYKYGRYSTTVHSGKKKFLKSLSELNGIQQDFFALQKLHLTVRVLFFKHARGGDCVGLSKEAAKIIRILSGDKTSLSKTISRNLKNSFEKYFFGNALVPISRSFDPLTAHSSPELSIAFMVFKVALEADNIYGVDKDIRLIVGYLKDLRQILRKPERELVKALSLLRSKSISPKNLIGPEKTDIIVYTLWIENGLDPAKLDEKAHEKMIVALNSAFSNQKKCDSTR